MLPELRESFLYHAALLHRGANYSGFSKSYVNHGGNYAMAAVFGIADQKFTPAQRNYMQPQNNGISAATANRKNKQEATMMEVSANLIWPGNKILIGKTPRTVESVQIDGGTVEIQYKAAAGAIRTKRISANKKVKIQ